MSKYQVKFYGQRRYKKRQRQANIDNCVAYVEHHFNSTEGKKANYTCVVTGSNASSTSKAWGRLYCKLVSEEFGTKNKGLLIGGYRGRGNHNLYYTNMPAILLEPLFVSNPEQAALIKTEEGQERLARCLVKSIKEIFPDGGLIGFSIGHKGVNAGAPVHGGGQEEQYAELVLDRAHDMLIGLRDEDEDLSCVPDVE